MLEGGCASHAGGLLQFLDKLPGVQGIHEVDVAGPAVQDGDGQLAAVVHIQGNLKSSICFSIKSFRKIKITPPINQINNKTAKEPANLLGHSLSNFKIF